MQYQVSLLDITETRITITVWAESESEAIDIAISRTNGGHDAYIV